MPSVQLSPVMALIFPRGDLHSEWVGAVEIHPEGLRLIHGEHDAAVLLP